MKRSGVALHPSTWAASFSVRRSSFICAPNAFSSLIRAGTFRRRHKPTEIYLCRNAAEPVGFCVKGFLYPLLLVCAQCSASKFKRANLKPTDAGHSSQLALRDPECKSVGSKIHRYNGCSRTSAFCRLAGSLVSLAELLSGSVWQLFSAKTESIGNRFSVFVGDLAPRSIEILVHGVLAHASFGHQATPFPTLLLENWVHDCLPSRRTRNHVGARSWANAFMASWCLCPTILHHWPRGAASVEVINGREAQSPTVVSEILWWLLSRQL